MKRLMLGVMAVLAAASSGEAGLFCGAARWRRCPVDYCQPAACYTSYRVERQTCYRTVYETCYEPQQQTCYRTVYDTTYEDVEETCYRTVVETAEREHEYTVQRPVYETSYREQNYCVQRPVWGNQLPRAELPGLSPCLGRQRSDSHGDAADDGNHQPSDHAYSDASEG